MSRHALCMYLYRARVIHPDAAEDTTTLPLIRTCTSPSGNRPAPHGSGMGRGPFPLHHFEPPPKPAYELAARGELHAKTVLKPGPGEAHTFVTRGSGMVSRDTRAPDWLWLAAPQALT